MRRKLQRAVAVMQNRVAAAALRSWRETSADLAQRRLQARNFQSAVVAVRVLCTQWTCLSMSR